VIPYPITLWHGSLGVGDGQDMATRGYLRSLLAVDYKNVVVSPRSSRVSFLDKPEIADLNQIIGYPSEFSAKLKRVEAGDPRIGQKWPHIEEDEMVMPVAAHAPKGACAVSWKNIIV
jgi:hypothetical protein